MLSRVGMHCGLIAARCQWPDLRHALEGHCGTLKDESAVSQADWFSPPDGQGVLHVASRGGCCYILDPGMMLSASGDLILALSRQLSCTVIGAGAETVSGTFWFTAADSGTLRRLHFNVKATLTEPFDLGLPLDSESSAALDDADGCGIAGGLGAFGFDTEVFRRGTDDNLRVLWAGEQFPEAGELDQKLNEHARAHQRPDADQWLSRIKVVSRGGGYDIRAEASRPSRSSLFRRYFGRH